MKKLVLSFVAVAFITGSLMAQDIFFTKNGHIKFFSSTPMENIEADNNKVTSILNSSTGDIEFSALIMAFEFEKALMQEHFNENYIESSKFPKAIFKGKILNLKDIDLKKDGTYPAKVKGDITIHGVTKEVTADGTFDVKDGKISASSSFILAPADFNIEIPAVVKDNIAKEIKVTVANNYEPFTRK